MPQNLRKQQVHDPFREEDALHRVLHQHRRLWCRQEGSRGRGLRGRADIESKAGLGAIFAPPLDLMFQGNFEEAQQEAQERNLWLVSALP